MQDSIDNRNEEQGVDNLMSRTVRFKQRRPTALGNRWFCILQSCHDGSEDKEGNQSGVDYRSKKHVTGRRCGCTSFGRSGKVVCGVDGMQYCDSRLRWSLSAVDCVLLCSRFIQLTGTLIIHPVEASVPLMQMMQKSMPTAPTRASTRSISCTCLVHFTLTFVLGLIAFALRFP